MQNLICSRIFSLSVQIANRMESEHLDYRSFIQHLYYLEKNLCVNVGYLQECQKNCLRMETQPSN